MKLADLKKDRRTAIYARIIERIRDAGPQTREELLRLCGPQDPHGGTVEKMLHVQALRQVPSGLYILGPAAAIGHAAVEFRKWTHLIR